jgi:hypothetical protein
VPPPSPDGNTPGLRIIQAKKAVGTGILAGVISQMGIILGLVRDVMAEVPDADFIEIRAIRYEEAEDERDVTPVPPGE